MILHKLAEELVDVCKNNNLEYDPRVLPVKLTVSKLTALRIHSVQLQSDVFIAFTWGDLRSSYIPDSSS